MNRILGIVCSFLLFSSIAPSPLKNSDMDAVQIPQRGAEVAIDDTVSVDPNASSKSALDDDEIRQMIAAASSSAIIRYHGDTDEVEIIEPDITATYDTSVSTEPYIPEGLPVAPPPVQSHVIIGPDDRGQITAPTLNAYPYCTLAYLNVTYKNGARTNGSGCFVGENKILTSAHVLYSNQNGVATSVTITPGGLLSNFSSVTTSEICLNSQYLNSPSVDQDYGVIVIEDSLETGYLGMSSKSKTELSNVILAGTYGYPADKATGTLWYSSGTLSSILERTFCHNADTMDGQSGSPLFDMADFNYVIGVHRGPYPYNPDINVATRVTKDMINFVNAC